MFHYHKVVYLGIALILVAIIAGCVAGPDSRFVEMPAGFWAGLWHGLICVVTFIISLFTDKVQMYEVNNTGGWYNFGFLFGLMIIFGGGRSGGMKSRVDEEQPE